MAQIHRALPARFLWASFQPPEPQVSLLYRQRLVTRVEEALRARLLLVVAPAGFGKSTLLSQSFRSLRAHHHVKCAWLNIIRDAGAGDLLLALCWALDFAGIDLRSSGLLSEPGDEALDSQERLPLLLAAVARSTEPIIVIVDEFDRLRDPESVALMEMLTAACPPNMHMVLASRRRPDFSISLLIAQGLVAYVLAEDLAFSKDETCALLREDMTPEDTELIVRKTEGWPVAVTLAKLWFRQSGHRPTELADFSGSTADVSAYLAEQVIAGLSPEAREFLLDVSVLDQISPSMANALRGREDATTRLHELLSLGPLVTALDSDALLVRLHPLLIEHLAKTLHMHDPSRFIRLHEAVAIESSGAGRLLDATRHALAASNSRLACELLVQRAPLRMCVMQGSAEVSACLRLLPEPDKRHHPRLRLCESFLLMRRGELLRAQQEFCSLRAERGDPSVEYLLESFVIDAILAFHNPRLGESKLEELRSAYEACGRTEPWATMVIETLAMVVHRRAGRLDAARRCSELQRAAYLGLAQSGSSLHISLHVNHTLLAEGRLSDAEVNLRKVLRAARSVVGPDRSIAAIARAFLFYIYYQADREDLTESEIDNLLKDLDRTDAWFDHYVFAYSVAIELAYRFGGMHTASQIISRGRIAGTRQGLGDSFQSLLRTFEADLAIRDGNPEIASRWLEELSLATVPSTTFYERDARCRLEARFHLARDQPENALEVATFWYEQAQAERRAGAVCCSRLIIALALKQLGSLERSAGEFAAALQWAATESAFAPFLEFRSQSAALIETFEESWSLSDEMTDFLDRLKRKVGQGVALRRISSTLTKREMEILQLLGVHDSNKHIARASKITEHAVKFHLKNIYRKLGVHSRAEALRALESARQD